MLKLKNYQKKIAGRKHPALVDPVYKSQQEGIKFGQDFIVLHIKSSERAVHNLGFSMGIYREGDKWMSLRGILVHLDPSQAVKFHFSQNEVLMRTSFCSF